MIANTAWRNPPEFTGGPWHCDAGPHVPRPEGVPWDDRIPYPVFAVATANDECGSAFTLTFADGDKLSAPLTIESAGAAAMDGMDH